VELVFQELVVNSFRIVDVSHFIMTELRDSIATNRFDDQGVLNL
jgi:hypothetical protein